MKFTIDIHLATQLLEATLLLTVLTIVAPKLATRLEAIMQKLTASWDQSVLNRQFDKSILSKSNALNPNLETDAWRLGGAIVCLLLLGASSGMASSAPDRFALITLPVLYMPSLVVNTLLRAWANRRQQEALSGLWLILWLLPLTAIPGISGIGSPSGATLLILLACALLSIATVYEICLLLILLLASLVLQASALLILLPHLLIGVGIFLCVVPVAVLYLLIQLLAQLHDGIAYILSPFRFVGDDIAASLEETLFAQPDSLDLSESSAHSDT